MDESVEAGPGSFAWPVEPECNTLESDQFLMTPVAEEGHSLTDVIYRSILQWLDQIAEMPN